MYLITVSFIGYVLFTKTDNLPQLMNIEEDVGNGILPKKAVFFSNNINRFCLFENEEMKTSGPIEPPDKYSFRTSSN